MKNYLLICLLCLFSACAEPQNKDEKMAYFFEIALQEEYGEGGVIRKWEEDILVYAFPNMPTYLLEELDKVIQELNQIIPPKALKIKKVNKKSKANVLIFCGDVERYVEEIEPLAHLYLSDNYALFYVHFDKNNTIYKASIFINTEEVKQDYIQKHLLREEFTQALGLFNDSELYPESVFYQKWSSVTSYSNLDKYLIQTLYNKKIKSGMTLEELKKVLDF